MEVWPWILGVLLVASTAGWQISAARTRKRLRVLERAAGIHTDDGEDWPD